MLYSKMKPMKVYDDSIIFPYNPSDRRHEQVIFLLSPDVNRSMDLLKYICNYNTNYRAIYMKKEVDALIDGSNKSLEESSDGNNLSFILKEVHNIIHSIFDKDIDLDVVVLPEEPYKYDVPYNVSVDTIYIMDEGNYIEKYTDSYRDYVLSQAIVVACNRYNILANMEVKSSIIDHILQNTVYDKEKIIKSLEDNKVYL